MEPVVVMSASMALVWAVMNVLRLWDRRFSLDLEDYRHEVLDEYPRLSVIIPACNEEQTIEPALRSLLAQDYPSLELVAINDRSTDGTGAILDRLGAEGDSRLKVVHIEELPPGWLGKNHALHCGAEVASGEVLLFTDADVHYAPGCLRLCLQGIHSLKLDHLVVAPEIITIGFWEQLMVTFFMLAFGLRFRPEIVHRNPRKFVGIGAFNMMTARAYERIGGHQGMPLQIADDMMLGKAVKEAGLRQAAVRSEGGVRVRWAIGLRGMVTGLEKNAYAGMDYSRWDCLAAVLVMSAGGLAPVLGCFWGGWVTVWCLVSWLLMGLAGYVAGRLHRAPAWIGLCFPLACLVLAFILFRSAWLAERRQGIYWRGTFYPLGLLRQQPPLGHRV